MNVTESPVRNDVTWIEFPPVKYDVGLIESACIDVTLTESIRWYPSRPEILVVHGRGPVEGCDYEGPKNSLSRDASSRCS
jgi:hypothetical protein